MLRPMLPLPERRGNTSILPKKKKLQQSIIKNNTISKKIIKQDDNDNRRNNSKNNNNINNDLKNNKKLSINDNNNNNVDNDNNTFKNRLTLYNLYKGNHIEIEPDDQLKQLRKSLGIIIKGNVKACPIPIISIDDPYLPLEFNTILKSLKIVTPTNVQMQSWSSILYGNDVLVISPTGTGKTLAYCLPIIIHILSRLNHCDDNHHHDKNQSNCSWNGIDDNNNKKRKYPSISTNTTSSSLSSSSSSSHNLLSPMALILLPTRELAIQVYSIIKSFKYHFKITSGIVYGGHDKIQQIEKLRSACHINNNSNSSNGSSSSSSSSSNVGLHILVATPGRLIDFIQSNNNNNNDDDDDDLSTMMINISNVSYLVIDEADRMLNLGFIEQLEKIFLYLSSHEKRQSLLFSATFLGKLNHIIEKYLKNPVIIRCNAMEFHDHSRVKNNNDNDNDDNNNGDGTRNDNNNNNNKIIHDINENISVNIKSHGNNNINDDTSNSSNSNYAVDVSNYNASADDNNNNDQNNDDEIRSTNKTVHFDNNNDSNNENNINNKTSSLTISPSIQQKIHVCASHKKPRLLIKYIIQCRNNEKVNKVRQVGSMLIFTNKIKTLKFLSEFLGKNSIKCEILHGRLIQGLREKVLNDFKSGKVNILLSTDVAARGIHINRLQYVVNYDFPVTLEQYCHRVGRTGRQGNTGFSYSLLTRNLAVLAKDLIQLLSICNQEVEPNLNHLANDYEAGLIIDGHNNDDDDDDDDDDDRK